MALILKGSIAGPAFFFKKNKPIRTCLQSFGRVSQNRAAQGRAVVIVLHDLTLAARFCDTLTLLDKGRVVASAPFAPILDWQDGLHGYASDESRGQSGDRPHLAIRDV